MDGTSLQFNFSNPNVIRRTQEMWFVEFHKMSVFVSIRRYSAFFLTSSLWVQFFNFSYKDIVYRVWSCEKWISKGSILIFLTRFSQIKGALRRELPLALYGDRDIIIIGLKIKIVIITKSFAY